jgi:uncharacterized protein YbcC (UPF0753/DUF2309 family)
MLLSVSTSTLAASDERCYATHDDRFTAIVAAPPCPPFWRLPTVAQFAARERTAATANEPVSPSGSLLEVIEHAAHFLPSQGPLTVFVHHNTLHAFEELTFTEAVRVSEEFYNAQPYLTEERYREELSRGRILPEDLAAVLEEELGDRADDLVGVLGTRFHLRLAMLQHPLRTAPSAELRWVVAETDALRTFRSDASPEVRQRMIDATRRWVMRDFRNINAAITGVPYPNMLRAAVADLFDQFGKASIEAWSDATWEAFCLQLLWRICVSGVQNLRRLHREPEAPARHRDAILEATGYDADGPVHEMLIRFCSAFLDQGFAHWQLPDRDLGFYRSFIELYAQPGGFLPRALGGLKGELLRLQQDEVAPLESIEESLELLGIGDDEREHFINESLLPLRGWAGMIWQLETNAEWAVRTAPKGTLVEYLAVRLLLDRCAAANAAADQLGYHGPLSELRDAVNDRPAEAGIGNEVQRAFLLFQLAQVLGLTPESLYSLPAKTWVRLADEVAEFSQHDRRRAFHLAYERRYYIETLDAMAIQARRRRTAGLDAEPQEEPLFQLACCIDDREESFRRHLEEIEPRCETFSYAGFYGVAMYYRGAGDAHPRPLCPVVIKPRHYVEEHPAYTSASSHRRRAQARRLLGSATHEFHVGSRSFFGGALTALVGSLASAPLVARILFPRTSAQFSRLIGKFVRPPAATQLLLERSQAEPGPEPGHIGYTTEEMAEIVERSLRDFGLTRRFARLVVLCGHGSSSLNNPHESAYNCGACSGGRGGPNARAFAQMANDPRVRAMLAARGLHLPADTYFLGAFHNTCNDDVEYFDLDNLPISHKELFEQSRSTIDEARRRNAHERCRRFESVELTITPAAALNHVQQRAEDLSQARPEYNHATNAVTYVGRRSRNRGLFMDRRAFMSTYDPTQDDEQSTILARVLSAVIPVCAGISLEYYFSTVDVQAYGCGSKLPHNIASLLGVMEGAASDLRTGLSAQMIEIHEPVRNLFIIETTPEAMERIMDNNPVIGRLCRNGWVKLATLAPQSTVIHVFRNNRFEPYRPESHELPEVLSSVDWYRGWRDHLGYAIVKEPQPAAAAMVAAGEDGR